MVRFFRRYAASAYLVLIGTLSSAVAYSACIPFSYGDNSFPHWMGLCPVDPSCGPDPNYNTCTQVWCGESNCVHPIQAYASNCTDLMLCLTVQSMYCQGTSHCA